MSDVIDIRELAAVVFFLCFLAFPLMCVLAGVLFFD
jgi:hypothetical protein